MQKNHPPDKYIKEKNRKDGQRPSFLLDDLAEENDRGASAPDKANAHYRELDEQLKKNTISYSRITLAYSKITLA